MADSIEKNEVQVPQKKDKIWRRLLNGLLDVTTALVFPVGLRLKNKTLDVYFSARKLAVYFAIYGLVQPLSTFLFPRAETILAQKGIDPALVTKVAPQKKIYVIPDTFTGKLHEIFRNNILYYLFDKNHDLKNTDVQAYETDNALSGSLMKIPLAVFFNDVSTIYLKSSNICETPDVLEIDSKIKKITNDKYGYAYPFSEKERKEYVLLHELRHASKDNEFLDPVMKEYDADLFALRYMADAHKDSSILSRGLLWRVMNDAQYTALLLDADINGTRRPTAQESQIASIAANKDEYRDTIGSYQIAKALGDTSCYPGTRLRKSEYKMDISRMTPLTQRWLTLFDKASESCFRLDKKNISVRP